jgi:hypothetical protein
VAELDYIKINGTKYELDPDPDVEPAAEIPQKLWQAADDGDFWQTWEMRSFQGGERRTRIFSKDQLDEMTYDDGEGIDVSTWGELKLQPDLTRVGGLYCSSATLPMVVSNDGQTVIVGHTLYNAKYLSTYAGTTWTQRTTPNAAAVTDLVVGTGTNIYGIQGTKIIESADDGATWADNASSGVPTDMVGLAFCANQLYALGPTYLKYWDGAAWTAAATWGGSFCCTYGEQVYFAKNNIIYRYNGTASYEADRLPQGFIITGLYSYRNILFIPGYFNVQGGKKGAVYYIMDGRDAHLYNIGSYDGSSNYTISAVAGSDDEVYLANQKRGGADRYDMTVGGLQSGPAWREAGVIPFKAMAYSNGKVLIGRYNTIRASTCQATGNDTTHIKLDASASATNDAYNGETIVFTGGAGATQTATISDYAGDTKIAVISTVATPADGTTTYAIGDSGVYVANVAIPTAYETTGWITSPEYDWFFPHDYKVFSQVVVWHKALAADQSVKVEYSLDGGVAYTVAGYSDIVGDTSKTFKITNARGRSFKLKLTLAGPGTTTPTVTYVRVDAAPLGEARSMWDFNLAAFSPRQGRQRIQALKTAYKSRSVVELEDLYDEKYSVVFEYLKIVPQRGDKWSAKVFLRLREV